MVTVKPRMKIHPSESDLADFLAGSMPEWRRRRVEAHIAACGECLAAVAAAHEAAGPRVKKPGPKKGVGSIVKKTNIYLILAVLSFALSFIAHRYFLQFLIATLLLGIKWIADSKSAKMLVMIYEAWKHGGDSEASRVLERIEKDSNIRF